MSSCGWVVASPPRRCGPHRQGDDATVYTDRWKWPLCAVLGRLCTLLQLARIVRATVGTQECTQIGQNGLSAPFWGVCVHYWAVGLGCGWPWDRNSVHKWEDRASPRRFGAFVYTVATRVAIRIATRAAPGGTSASTATACRRRLLAGPSRLVGKIGSARVAPLPGWRLRRGSDPHEPPKSLIPRVICEAS